MPFCVDNLCCYGTRSNHVPYSGTVNTVTRGIRSVIILYVIDGFRLKEIVVSFYSRLIVFRALLTTFNAVKLWLDYLDQHIDTSRNP